jgi:hypothetical protein
MESHALRRQHLLNVVNIDNKIIAKAPCAVIIFLRWKRELSFSIYIHMSLPTDEEKRTCGTCGAPMAYSIVHQNGRTAKKWERSKDLRNHANIFYENY